MAERKTEDDTSAEQVSKELSLSGKNRFVPMEERRDTSVLPVDVIKNIWDGKTCVIVNSNLNDWAEASGASASFVAWEFKENNV